MIGNGLSKEGTFEQGFEGSAVLQGDCLKEKHIEQEYRKFCKGPEVGVCLTCPWTILAGAE